MLLLLRLASRGAGGNGALGLSQKSLSQEIFTRTLLQLKKRSIVGAVMKRSALTLLFILTFLFTIVAETNLFSGAEGNSASDTVKVGPDALRVAITSPYNKTYYTHQIQLNLTASYGGAPFVCKYSVDNGPFINVPLMRYDVITVLVDTSIGLNLQDGYHIIIAKAILNQEIEAVATVTFTIDTVPPYLSIMAPENQTYKTSDIPLEYTAAGYPQVRYSLDGKANVSITENSTLSGVIDGPHNMILYGTSESGSVFASEPVYFGVNTGRPVISILSIENDTTYYTNNLDLIFYLSEPSPEIKYGLWDQSEYHGILGPFEPFIVITGNVTMTNLHSGLYLLILTAQDSLTGDISFKEVFFGIENPFPTALVVAVSIVTVVVVGIALLVYFKKRKH